MKEGDMLRTSRQVGRAVASHARMSVRGLAFGDSFRDRSSSDYMEQPPSNYGFAIVPQQKAYIIERFGKFDRELPPGLHLLIPFVDKIAYVHNLKEQAFTIPNQSAITKDNVTIDIDGVLYVRITKPYDASYGVENVVYAVMQLAQTTMRSELGKITLDKTFEERETLNDNIVNNINLASDQWGIQCLRYEIKDISPPPAIKLAMDMQAEAERKKRAGILESEGFRQAQINKAEGSKRQSVLEAEGEAESILVKARATAAALELVGKTIDKDGGHNAVALRVAEQYIESFGQLAKKGTTVVIPADVNNASSMVAAAMGIYANLSKKRDGGDGDDNHTGGGSSSAVSSDSGTPTIRATKPVDNEIRAYFDPEPYPLRKQISRDQ